MQHLLWQYQIRAEPLAAFGVDWFPQLGEPQRRGRQHAESVRVDPSWFLAPAETVESLAWGAQGDVPQHVMPRRESAGVDPSTFLAPPTQDGAWQAGLDLLPQRVRPRPVGQDAHDPSWFLVPPPAIALPWRPQDALQPPAQAPRDAGWATDPSPWLRPPLDVTWLAIFPAPGPRRRPVETPGQVAPVETIAPLQPPFVVLPGPQRRRPQRGQHEQVGPLEQVVALTPPFLALPDPIRRAWGPDGASVFPWPLILVPPVDVSWIGDSPMPSWGQRQAGSHVATMPTGQWPLPAVVAIPPSTLLAEITLQPLVEGTIDY